MTRGGIGSEGPLDNAARSSGYLHDRCVDIEETNELRKSVVVCEDNDLARPSSVFEDSSKACDLRGIHRLDGVIDNDEPEWALGHRHARKEDRKRECVE